MFCRFPPNVFRRFAVLTALKLCCARCKSSNKFSFYLLAQAFHQMFCIVVGARSARPMSRNILSPCLRVDEAERRRGLNRRGRVGLPLYSTAVFTLNTLNLCSSSSLSLLTFCRAKSYKNARHKLSKSFKALARELLCNITHPPFTCRSCLPFQSREQKNSLHALPTSHGAHAQTLLF